MQIRFLKNRLCAAENPGGLYSFSLCRRGICVRVRSPPRFNQVPVDLVEKLCGPPRPRSVSRTVAVSVVGGGMALVCACVPMCVHSGPKTNKQLLVKVALNDEVWVWRENVLSE